jgi:hypothetical protein
MVPDLTEAVGAVHEASRASLRNASARRGFIEALAAPAPRNAAGARRGAETFLP